MNLEILKMKRLLLTAVFSLCRCHQANTQEEGSLRLQSVTATKGTLEIYHSELWGSICDDGFTDRSATVACKQLGLGTVGLTFQTAYFGQSASGGVWLSQVTCLGNETDLLSCPNSGWLNHNCESYMDVGIECLDSYNYRIIDGPTPNAGRVEVMADGFWATVCGIGFDMDAADVICNYLGYSGAYGFHLKALFGTGIGWIRYSNILCTGNENSLAECQHTVGDDGICISTDAVGVTCRGGPIRLTSDTGNPREGAIEMFHGGQWGAIKSHSIDDNTVKVVCRIMGYGDIGYLRGSYFHGVHNVPWILESMNCLGNETDLVECPHSPWISIGGYSYGAGVFVKFDLTDIRLVGGTLPWEGRVEILVDGVWGTICDDNWDKNDANVVCRMLGYEKAENAFWNAFYGPGNGSILADDVACQGNESHLMNCTFTRFNHNCGHMEDASVSCSVDSRCAHQWIVPATSKFVMRKTTTDQSNYTELATYEAVAVNACMRKCSLQARQTCGDINECSLVIFDDTIDTCTLYHKINETTTAPCSDAIPCFINIDFI